MEESKKPPVFLLLAAVLMLACIVFGVHKLRPKKEGFCETSTNDGVVTMECHNGYKATASGDSPLGGFVRVAEPIPCAKGGSNVFLFDDINEDGLRDADEEIVSLTTVCADSTVPPVTVRFQGTAGECDTLGFSVPGSETFSVCLPPESKLNLDPEATAKQLGTVLICAGRGLTMGVLNGSSLHALVSQGGQSTLILAEFNIGDWQPTFFKEEAPCDVVLSLREL